MDIEVDRRVLRRYAVGDLVVIALFVAIGEFSHGANPLLVVDAYVQTVVTFVVGWIVAAPVVGAYRSDTLTDPRRAIVVPVLAWAVADAIGQGLRATAFFEGDAEVTFFLVVFFVGGAMLGAWRYLAFRASRR